MNIHPSAIVSPNARLEEGVVVGPYAFIGERVRLGKGTVIQHHATVDGNTIMGEENIVYPYAFIGGHSASKYSEGREEGKLVIGSKNTFREYSTAHTSNNESGTTLIGDQNWIMQYAHVGHDVAVGNHVILSSSVQLAGHSEVRDGAYMNSRTTLQQFLKIGEGSMTGGFMLVKQNVFPLTIYDRARHRAPNVIGMERAKYSKEEIKIAKDLFKLFFLGERSFKERIEVLTARNDNSRPVRLYKGFLDAIGKNADR